ncbi:hypothetical protein [Neptuniibacter sp. CAU 1671]|uniref:hypothetical protein n=1 Tax=Neptuniibacter sp. CAU 1671 TaxID=3032593 RepID=UPI0023DAD13E|nr:hypothetical protein [Neptuniibacter sp. CAU 1671]MDF2183131.1 hypothetical protein [Neptuniibacter sp. CAU 1671]
MFNGLDELEDFASRLAPPTPEEAEAARLRAAQTKQSNVVTPIRANAPKQTTFKTAAKLSTPWMAAAKPGKPVSADQVVEKALSKAAGETQDTNSIQGVSAFVGPLLPPDWKPEPTESTFVAEVIEIAQPATEISTSMAEPVTEAPVIIDMTIPPEPEKSYLKYVLMASGLLIAMMSAVLFF